MEWVWVSNETSDATIRMKIAIAGFAIAVFFFALDLYYAFSEHYVNAVIALSFIILLFIAAIIYEAYSIKSSNKDTSVVKRVRISRGRISIETSGHTVSYRLGEVFMCYEVVIWGRGLRSSYYHVHVRYPGGSIKMPYLLPERFGELKQVLKSYGIEIEECD